MLCLCWIFAPLLALLEACSTQSPFPYTSFLSSYLALYLIWEDCCSLNLQFSKDSGSTSFAQIIATLIPTSITAIIFLAIFVSIRLTYRKIYAPRTFMVTIPEKWVPHLGLRCTAMQHFENGLRLMMNARHRTPSSSQRGSHWIHDFRSLHDKFVLRHQSLDGYLYLRFLKVIILMCSIGCCLTWPILFPVNATGGGEATQLDRLSFSNINDNKRLYAHAIVAWLFLGIFCLMNFRKRR